MDGDGPTPRKPNAYHHPSQQAFRVDLTPTGHRQLFSLTIEPESLVALRLAQSSPSTCASFPLVPEHKAASLIATVSPSRIIP